jgi:hypothetical protein
MSRFLDVSVETVPSSGILTQRKTPPNGTQKGPIAGIRRRHVTSDTKRLWVAARAAEETNGGEKRPILAHLVGSAPRPIPENALLFSRFVPTIFLTCYVES